MRGSWRTNRTAIYWPPLLWPSALCLSRSPGLLNRRPRAQLSVGWWLSLLHLITNWSGPQTPSGVPRAPPAECGFPYPILSPTSLIPNSSDFQLNKGPEGPFGLVWFSLPHLISNFSGPQLTDFLSSQSYIIVQRPLNRPLNLWNGMFDRHQAEITDMQFRAHSLPVHQSMSVSWDFFLVPFRQPISAYPISFDYWPLECVTSSRCITLEWHVWPGRRSKYNTMSVFVWTTTLDLSPFQIVAELVFGKIRPSVVFSGAPESLANHWFPIWSISPRMFYICCRHWFYPPFVQQRRSCFRLYSSLQFFLLPGRKHSSCVSPQLFLFLFSKQRKIFHKPGDLVGSLHM